MAGEARGAMRSVIVVDDDDLVRTMLRDVLDGHRELCVVGEAADGATAISVCDTAQPDVVVLDMGLPDLTGSELLTALRERHPGLAVVVYTGSASAAATARRLGATEVLTKGETDLPTLLASLERVRPEQQDSRATWSFPHDVRSVREARRAVAAVLAGWGLDEAVDGATLVVSELATNAVTHAGTAFDLVLERSPGALRIEVADTGPGVPEPRTPDDHGPGGRGLHLVADIATSWGITPTADGKAVWATLAVDPA